jgi:hypothetical protein
MQAPIVDRCVGDLILAKSGGIVNGITCNEIARIGIACIVNACIENVGKRDQKGSNKYQL